MMSLYFVPLNAQELAQLRTYIAEVARGLVHTDAWHKRMAALQVRYDRTQGRT